MDYWTRHDPEFAVRYGTARDKADDVIRKEIYRRSIEGVERPVFQGGKQVGTVRDFSDVLLIFLAKSRMPEFRERVDLMDEVRRVALREGLDPDEAVAHAERALKGLSA